MNELSKKILESGLVDHATAEMLEKFGLIDEGASTLTRKEHLRNATRETLIKFAEDLEGEIDKRRRLRESMLDLNQLRWPVVVDLFSYLPTAPSVTQGCLAVGVSALIDRMGRYYFRPPDVQKRWLTPGYYVFRRKTDENGLRIAPTPESILETTELMIGDQVAAIQVSTSKE